MKKKSQLLQHYVTTSQLLQKTLCALAGKIGRRAYEKMAEKEWWWCLTRIFLTNLKDLWMAWTLSKIDSLVDVGWFSTGMLQRTQAWRLSALNCNCMMFLVALTNVRRCASFLTRWLTSTILSMNGFPCLIILNRWTCVSCGFGPIQSVCSTQSDGCVLDMGSSGNFSPATWKQL